MKSTVTIEQNTCDFCGKGEAWPGNSCLRCGKDICYKCSEQVAKKYSHAVYFSGSGDGQYCNECDALLCRTREDPLYNAYAAIQALRDESAAWNDDFKKRSDIAEQRLVQLQKK